ncbi:MAG: hemolysin III family protein [Chloroherpetonaceae bacterium]
MQTTIETQSALPRYTEHEERANILTHGLGVVLSLVGLSSLAFLAFRFGEVWHQISLLVYGISLVMLYVASVVYHSMKEEKSRLRMRIFDHASIYLLIAGTYTPFSLVNLREDWGVPLLVAVWILAAVGIVLKFFFINAKKWVSAALYIGLGWLVVIAIEPVLAHVPMRGLLWLLSGGVIYTVGVVFYVWKSLPYHHAIWHMFVLAGSVCHFLAVMASSVPFET